MNNPVTASIYHQFLDFENVADLNNHFGDKDALIGSPTHLGSWGAWLQPAWHDGGCDVDQDQAEVAETVEQRRLLNTYIPYAIYGNVQSL